MCIFLARRLKKYWLVSTVLIVIAILINQFIGYLHAIDFSPALVDGLDIGLAILAVISWYQKHKQMKNNEVDDKRNIK